MQLSKEKTNLAKWRETSMPVGRLKCQWASRENTSKLNTSKKASNFKKQAIEKEEKQEASE